jgi:serine/threonine protein kinase
MIKESNFLRKVDISKTYKLISEVGAGTYGVVYKARNMINNKFVALKKIELND